MWVGWMWNRTHHTHSDVLRACHISIFIDQEESSRQVWVRWPLFPWYAHQHCSSCQGESFFFFFFLTEYHAGEKEEMCASTCSPSRSRLIFWHVGLHCHVRCDNAHFSFGIEKNVKLHIAFEWDCLFSSEYKKMCLIKLLYVYYNITSVRSVRWTRLSSSSSSLSWDKTKKKKMLCGTFLFLLDCPGPNCCCLHDLRSQRSEAAQWLHPCGARSQLARLRTAHPCPSNAVPESLAECDISFTLFLNLWEEHTSDFCDFCYDSTLSPGDFYTLLTLCTNVEGDRGRAQAVVCPVPSPDTDKTTGARHKLKQGLLFWQTDALSHTPQPSFKFNYQHISFVLKLEIEVKYLD